MKAVDRSNVGITVDTFHFHEMCSKLEDLKAADGNKIFAYHLNDCEDLPLDLAEMINVYGQEKALLITKELHQH